MANADRANGFIYHSNRTGVWCPPPIQELPAAGTNEPMGLGDLVSMTAAGSVDRTCTDGGGDHQQDTVVGVFQGCLYKNAAGDLVEGTYLPAAQGDDTETLTAGAGALVRFLPLTETTVFSVQCDDDGGTAISQTLVGNAADPLALEATDPTQLGPNGRSNQEIDTSTAGSAADLFHIIGLHKKPGRVFSTTEADSRFGRVLVVPAEQLYGSIPTVSGV